MMEKKRRECKILKFEKIKKKKYFVDLNVNV